MSDSLCGPPPDSAFTDDEVWTSAPAGPPALAASSPDILESEMRWPSEWHLMAYMAARGYPQKRIAEELQYDQSRVSIVLNKREVQLRIERIRKEDSKQLGVRYADIAPRALDYFERLVDGKEAANTGQRMVAAQWIMEKADGKPVQKVQSDEGSVAKQILEALQSLRDRPSESGVSSRDVGAGTESSGSPGSSSPLGTESGREAPDDVSSWISSHLVPPTKE